MEIGSLTIETFLQDFYTMKNDSSEIKKILLKERNHEQPESDQWFDLSGLCKYHPDRPTRQTVYCWIQDGKIPYHKSSKKLRFLKSEIDNWLKTGKRKTTNELRAEAESFISKNKRG